MAEFHLHGQIIKRSEGRSAVNAAAYRAGKALHDQRLDQTFDYTGKHDVEESIILGPDHAPEWMFDREMLWNTVEAAERHKRAQLAREFDIALPIELVQKDVAAAKDVLNRWAADMFVAQGLMVDINFHNMGGKNPHAHVMKTLRRVHPQAMGFGEGSRYAFEETKARDQNDWGYMDHWRETWADYANAAMAAHNIDARIDHRTLIEQEIDREPGIHIGPVANAMEARGEDTGRWLKNALIWFDNEESWFEEVRRYVAFLDAEEAKERQRQEEEAARQETERKENDAAAAVVARANDLGNLARRLNAAFDSQIGKSATGLGDLTVCLGDCAKAPIAAARPAFDDAVKGLARAKVKIEAGLLSCRKAVARLEVRLGTAVEKAVNSETSRLRGSVGRLTEAIEVVLGDHAIRFYEVADRLAAQANIVTEVPTPDLSSPGTRLGVSTPDEPVATERPKAAGDPLAKGKESSRAVRPQQPQIAAENPDRFRPVIAAKIAKFRSDAAQAFENGQALVRSVTSTTVRSVLRASEVTKEAVGGAASRTATFLKVLIEQDVGRERAFDRQRSTDQGKGETPAPVPNNERSHQREGELFGLRLSVLERARSLAASLKRVREARKAKAAAKAAEAAEAAINRNLQLAETAIRARVDYYSAPDIEQSFVNAWIRTLNATEGSMETRYREADRVALRGYALRMDRHPRFDELGHLLIRLSPFAGGVDLAARSAPRELPEGMKPDMGRQAYYSPHVRWVSEQLGLDPAVSEHLSQLQQRSSTPEEDWAEMFRNADRGRRASPSRGRTGSEIGDD